MSAEPRGAVLLDVIAALAIMAVVGVSTIATLAQIERTAATTRMSEDRLADASRLLTAMTLLSARDLEERLGRTGAGPYEVVVGRESSVLYQILIQSQRTRESLLETLVYRPESR